MNAKRFLPALIGGAICGAVLGVAVLLFFHWVLLNATLNPPSAMHASARMRSSVAARYVRTRSRSASAVGVRELRAAAAIARKTSPSLERLRPSTRINTSSAWASSRCASEIAITSTTRSGMWSIVSRNEVHAAGDERNSDVSEAAAV